MVIPDLLFHMTTAAFAAEVCDALSGPPWDVAIDLSDGQCGRGLYALSEPPDGEDPDELRFWCFGDARPEHPMDGVLVLDPSGFDPDWEPIESRWPQWMWPVDSMDPQWIGEFVVRTGTRQRGGRAWNYVDHD